MQVRGQFSQRILTNVLKQYKGSLVLFQLKPLITKYLHVRLH